MTDSRWNDGSDHPITTCSFRAAFTDEAVIRYASNRNILSFSSVLRRRLEAIAIHPGTDRIINPAVFDPARATLSQSKNICKKGTDKASLLMTVGIAQTSTVDNDDAEVAQRLGILPLDLTWYRSAGFMCNLLREKLYYPTWLKGVQFSTAGKLRTRPSFGSWNAR